VANVPSTLAAIDCGTNSTRLLVADRSGEALVRLMRITRLGDRVDATHVLKEEAVDRTLAVLGEFRRIMDEQHVGRGRMVATSAVRDARNGDEFLASASGVVGIPAELLSGEEEGRLAFEGATAELPPGFGDDVVVDIGGGSTELVTWCDGRTAAISMDIGCVRITERFFVHDPPQPAEQDRARAAIDERLASAAGALPTLGQLRSGSRLVGLAGTVSTLAMLELGLGTYDRDRIHHAILSAVAVDHWCRVLGDEPSTARAVRPGMVPGREDVIFGGALILQRVLHRFGFGECIVSESDILDGLVASINS